MNIGAKVYIGFLPYCTKEKDVEFFFRGYGRIGDIDLKQGYAFVRFNDYKDADFAVNALNRKKLDGRKVNVGHARTTRFCLIVENVHPGVNWQYLKEYMERAGKVTHAQKYNKFTGIVDFFSYTGMKNALDTLDGTKIKGKRIRLITNEPSKKNNLSYSKSRSYSLSRLRNHSPSWDRSWSRLRRRNQSWSLYQSSSRSRRQRLSRSRSRSGTYQGHSSSEKFRSPLRSRSRCRSRSGTYHGRSSSEHSRSPLGSRSHCRSRSGTYYSRSSSEKFRSPLRSQSRCRSRSGTYHGRSSSEHSRSPLGSRSHCRSRSGTYYSRSSSEKFRSPLRSRSRCRS